MAVARRSQALRVLQVGHVAHGQLGGMPRTRAECRDGPRPCVWIGCRHHLWRRDSVDTVGRPARGRELVGVGLVDDPPLTSCALDIAERHPDGLSEIGVAELLGISPRHVRRIVRRARAKLRRKGKRLRLR